jgi:hypothetical protein
LTKLPVYSPVAGNFVKINFNGADEVAARPTYGRMGA